jgi:uncharacterized protein (DUF1697 family)
VTRYVALLRGINVGANKRISMADLRTLITGLGHTDVATHLQSGNAVFTSTINDPDQVVRALEQRIDAELGMRVDCLVRTAAQMRAVVDHNPLAEVATDPAKHVVTFLSAALDPAKLAAIDPADYAPEQFHVVEREIYMWFPDGIRDARLGRVPWDRRFGVVASGRNWNTVKKLADLAEA